MPQIDRENRDRDQEADELLEARAGVLDRIVVDADGVAIEAAQRGDHPEAVDAQREDGQSIEPPEGDFQNSSPLFDDSARRRLLLTGLEEHVIVLQRAAQAQCRIVVVIVEPADQLVPALELGRLFRVGLLALPDARSAP